MTSLTHDELAMAVGNPLVLMARRHDVADLLNCDADFERRSGVRPHRSIVLAADGDPQLHERLRPRVEGAGVLHRCCPQAVERSATSGWSARKRRYLGGR